MKKPFGIIKPAKGFCCYSFESFSPSQIKCCHIKDMLWGRRLDKNFDDFHHNNPYVIHEECEIQWEYLEWLIEFEKADGSKNTYKVKVKIIEEKEGIKL